MNEPLDRRESFRLPFTSKVICHVNNSDNKFSGTLRNINVHGTFLVMDDCPDEGEQCSLEIILEGDHSRLVVDNISGRVGRRDEDGVAITFDEQLEWFSLIPLCYKKLSEFLDS